MAGAHDLNVISDRVTVRQKKKNLQASCPRTIPEAARASSWIGRVYFWNRDIPTGSWDRGRVGGPQREQLWYASQVENRAAASERDLFFAHRVAGRAA